MPLKEISRPIWMGVLAIALVTLLSACAPQPSNRAAEETTPTTASSPSNLPPASEDEELLQALGEAAKALLALENPVSDVMCGAFAIEVATLFPEEGWGQAGPSVGSCEVESEWNTFRLTALPIDMSSSWEDQPYRYPSGTNPVPLQSRRCSGGDFADRVMAGFIEKDESRLNLSLRGYYDPATSNVEVPSGIRDEPGGRVHYSNHANYFAEMLFEDYWFLVTVQGDLALDPSTKSELPLLAWCTQAGTVTTVLMMAP